MFAKFGISEEVISDGGSKFSSFSFQNFPKHFGFYRTLSSSRYTQSNGEAERTVQKVKKFLKKLHDPYLEEVQMSIKEKKERGKESMGENKR